MKKIETKAKIEPQGHQTARKANLSDSEWSFCAFIARRNRQLQAIMVSQAIKNAMPEIEENLQSRQYHRLLGRSG